MRRLSTGLLVVAIAGLGLAAAVDELRPDAARPRAGGQSAPLDAPGYREAARALRSLGAGGTITYSDDACRLHALRLPDLTPAPAPAITSCEPHIGGGGIGTWKGDVVWAGLGFGTSQVVLSSEDLTAAVQKRRRWADVTYRARQAVSLGEGEYAIAVESPEEPWHGLLVFFTQDRLRAIAASSVGSGEIIRPSPSSEYVALFEPGRAGVRLFTRTGAPVSLPPVQNPHAIAWSADERWTALATRWSLYVFESGSATSEIARIPLAVRDLDWAA